jgi:hypothetical protein
LGNTYFPGTIPSQFLDIFPFIRKEDAMDKSRHLLAAILASALLLGGCSEKKSNNPSEEAVPGKITASVSGITG